MACVACFILGRAIAPSFKQRLDEGCSTIAGCIVQWGVALGILHHIMSLDPDAALQSAMLANAQS